MKTNCIYKISIVIITLLLCGCTNHITEVKSRMANNYHLFMDQHVAAMNSSLQKISPAKITKKKLFKAIPSAIFQFELSSIGNQKISLKQYNEVRNNTLQIIKDSLNLYIIYKDKETVKSLVDSILKLYSEQFPVKNAYSYYKEQREFAGTFVQFIEARNEGYCNEENLLPGDCNWGYIFLSANGKSLLQFQCVGSDSIRYDIGNYRMISDTLVCTFKNSYSYLEKYDSNTGVSISDPNDGKINPEKDFIIKLLSCECLQYPFIIKYTNEEDKEGIQIQTYVVKIATLKEQDDFIKLIRNIKPIANMIK